MWPQGIGVDDGLRTSGNLLLYESHENIGNNDQNRLFQGSLGGAAVWRLPLAQGTILGSLDRVPRRAPRVEPASPSACVYASLSVYVYHK